MKVLITGANGLLAANLVRELNARSIDVRGMVRKTSNLLSLEGAQFEKVFGDITNYEELFDAAEGCDVIIHTAANTSQRPDQQKNTDDQVGTQNVIRVTEVLKIPKLIYVSSANAFGYGSKERPGDESIPISPVFRKSLYAVNKLSAQEIVLQAAREGRINATVVNPTFIIGPYDSKPGSGRLMLMYLNNKFAICPPGGKNFVHVDDASVAICNAILKGRNGEAYLLTGENLSYHEFYAKVSDVTGIHRPLIPLPKMLLQSIGIAGSLMNKFGFQQEMNRSNAEILSINNYYSGQKAIEELDMPQTPIEYAIEDAFHWFLLRNYLKFNTQVLHANA